LHSSEETKVLRTMRAVGAVAGGLMQVLVGIEQKPETIDRVLQSGKEANESGRTDAPDQQHDTDCTTK